MCGILGLSVSNLTLAFRESAKLGVSCLRHRGPNDSGFCELRVGERDILFCHTRLSIIDLTNGGHQPKYSKDKSLVVSFNGEIYNYRELRQELYKLGHSFSTDSDTEVLLACWAEWGEECLQRLRGMFAFAICDRLKNTITLVRDAFGIKPLFYFSNSEVFCFGSEILALLKLIPNKPKHNVQRAFEYLVDGSYDNSSNTFFEDIHHVLPGHIIQIDLDDNHQSLVRRWWYPSIKECENLTFNDAADQLRALYLNNISLHMRSDVPIGAALSGGIDSSAVVCAMRYLEPELPLHTFSYIATGSDLDEEKWVDVVNSHVGAIKHKVRLSHTELCKDLDNMILAQGEPFCGTSIYAQYRVFKLAQDHGITVTLDGQGADELLAGYGGFPEARIKSLISLNRWVDLLSFINAWSKGPGRSKGQALRMGIKECLPTPILEVLRDVRKKTLPDWINIDVLENSGVKLSKMEVPLKEDVGRHLVSNLRQAMCGNGLSALLRHADRNSMHWSIESRVPFLTTDFAEFCLQLPEDYLVSPKGESKHIFRAAMRGIVPDVILDRKDKIGFATPENIWLREIGEQVLTWLDSAESIPFLNVEKLRVEMRSIITGQKAYTPQAWRIVNYCRWAEKF